MNIRTTEDQDARPLQNLHNDDPETYEQYILIALYKSAEFRALALESIGWSNVSNRAINLFEYPFHYAIYKVIKAWRTANQNADISEALLATFLTSISAQPYAPISEDDIPEVIELFNNIMAAVDAENALAVVSDTWRDWAKYRSLKRVLQDLVRSGAADPEGFREDINRSVDAFSENQDNDTSAEFGDGMDEEEVIVERIPLSPYMKPLNICLGGGFGKTEHAMFVAPTGGGKTVLACQLASDMASNGYQVLFISTEQKSRELEPRIISCMSEGTGNPILFDTIKDGVLKEKLSPGQWELIQNIRKALRGNLHFENWVASGKSVSSDINAAVEKQNRKLESTGKKIDCVILDWIGGAIASGTADQHVKRMRLQEAATEMKNLAYRQNVATISFAQATTAAGKKTRIDGNDLAENKQLHQEAVALFGISAKTLSDDAGADSTATYDDNQTMYCAKSRKSKSLVIHITRCFQYQKYKFGAISKA